MKNLTVFSPLKMPTYNFDDKKSDFSLIPEGIYDAQVEKIEERTSSSGNKYKHLTFRLIGEKAEKEKVNGRLIWDNLVLLEQVEWKIQNLLYACGLPYEGSVTLSSDWKELIGKTLKLGIGTREYQNQQYNDIKNFYAGNIKVQTSSDRKVSEEDIPIIEEKASSKKKNSSKKKEASQEKEFSVKEDSEEEINIDDIPF
jgi:hypothetical protein